MNQRTTKWAQIAVFTAILVLGFVGCHKKPAAAPPPPPPPPAAPTASITANPSTIERGQSTTLSWRTENATDVNIDGLGAVDANGSKQVTPTDSTTYRLVAKGAGGQQEATARVTVTAPPAAPPTTAGNLSDEQMFNQSIKDAFFDYDKYDVRADGQQALAGDADFLKAHPNIKFLIEGHCDERGSTEYNLGLGDNHANSAKQFLVQQGVSADRIRTTSFGKEKPFCTQSTEECWQQNRRAHFVYQP
ncbi:MAG: peptidoglycan-associated lipoprotein Pal [Acidobacteriaceae bacterium]|nr:peptidoglycan-associated lipoprotein Pal [Acidobacteriaceae bacterium]